MYGRPRLRNTSGLQSMTTARGRAAGEAAFDLSGEEMRYIMEFIMESRRDGRITASFSCEGFTGGYEHEVRDQFFFCRAGINVGSVLADGSISACPSLRGDYIQGNIYRDSFMATWNRRFRVMRDREWARTGECAACDAWKWCHGNGLHLRDEQSRAVARCHYRLMRQ